MTLTVRMSDISIHALFAEGDRRRTARRYDVQIISIHALFAEGDLAGDLDGLRRVISIHALFAEGDCRGDDLGARVFISIHALFAEGDTLLCCCQQLIQHFYPRPLRRGRPRT